MRESRLVGLASPTMTGRCVVLGLVLALTAPPAALAQDGGGNPFGPLPQPPPPAPEQPAPQPVEREIGQDDGLGGAGFWMIVGTTGALFLGIAFLIGRDMRRTVGTRRKPKRMRARPAAGAADALAGDGHHRPGSRKARGKAQQRAKAKAARKQRRRTRSR